MKHRALKICIENFAPNNPNPYQEYLTIVPFKTDDLKDTFWEIEICGGKLCYHFKEYLNCYCIQNIYYECERFIITRIEYTTAEW